MKKTIKVVILTGKCVFKDVPKVHLFLCNNLAIEKLKAKLKAKLKVELKMIKKMNWFERGYIHLKSLF